MNSPLKTGGFSASRAGFDVLHTGYGTECLWQVFDDAGHPVSNAVQRGGYDDQGGTQVALLETGTIAELWVDKSNGWALRAQIFDLNRKARTAELTLDAKTANYADDFSLIALSNGNFAVSWRTHIQILGPETFIPNFMSGSSGRTAPPPVQRNWSRMATARIMTIST